MDESQLTVKKVGGILVFEQRDSDWFFLGKNTLAISVYQLTALLKFLIKHGYLSKKVLEGILSELSE